MLSPLRALAMVLLFGKFAAELLIINIASTPDISDLNTVLYTEDMLSYQPSSLDTESNYTNSSLPIVRRTLNISSGFQAMDDICEMATASNISTVIAIVSCDSSTYVTSVLQRLRIPAICIVYGSCDLYEGHPPAAMTSSPYVTDIRVDRTSIIQIFENLISAQGWTKLIIFYDTDNGGALLTDLLFSSLSTINTTAAVYDIGSNVSDETLCSLLQTIKPNPDFILPYVTFTSGNLTKRLLNKAESYQMRTLENRWVLLGDVHNPNAVESVLGKEDNLAVVAGGSVDDMFDHVTFEVAKSTDLVQQIHKEIVNSQPSSTHERHMMASSGNICQSSVSEKLRSRLAEALQETLPSQFVYNRTYPEYKIQSSTVRQDNVPTMEEVGEWTSKKEFQFKHNLFPNSFNGFNNRKFRVASLEYSFFQKKIYQRDGSVKWAGLTFTIMDELAKDLNFRYEVVEPPDMFWGIRTENGTWNGMIAMVINKSVDFAAAGFSVTADREVAVDFAQPYFYETSAVILQRPENENKVTLYLKPFKWQVWLSSVAAVFLYSTLLWIMTRFSPFHFHITERQDIEQGAACIKNAFLYFFGCLMQQGGVWLPKSQSGRILVGCFWFFSIVIVATYTGNLIAFLAVNSVTLPFNSLSELVAQNKIEWGPANGVAMVMLFRDATFEPYTSVYRGMKPVNSYAEGLKRVREGNYAFIAEKSWYQAEVDKDCSLAMIKETFYPTNYAWAFPTNAPIIKIFNDRINKMRESGLLTHWTKKWTPPALNCTGLRPVTNAKTVDLTDFQGALYVLGAGLLISVIILASEVIQKSKKNSCVLKT